MGGKDFFDYENKHLSLWYRGEVHFNLELGGRITQVTGDSATGKTFLTNAVITVVKDMELNNSPGINLMAYNSKPSIQELRGQSGNLIILDRADLYLDDELVEFIRNDLSNCYLIFARQGYSFGISPSHVGELTEKDGVFSIHFKFKERGWG